MKKNYMKRVNNNYETDEYYKSDSETSYYVTYTTLICRHFLFEINLNIIFL